MKCVRTAVLAILFSLTAVSAEAADPVRPATPPVPLAERGIWAAIAYSPSDGRHGFFWGADRRDEAETLSLEHCENAGGASCRVVETFRNHRHWDDDDGSGFPDLPCGALAVREDDAGRVVGFASHAAPTRKDAEDEALALCQGDGGLCRIREWVCT